MLEQRIRTQQERLGELLSGRPKARVHRWCHVEGVKGFVPARARPDGGRNHRGRRAGLHRYRPRTRWAVADGARPQRACVRVTPASEERASNIPAQGCRECPDETAHQLPLEPPPEDLPPPEEPEDLELLEDELGRVSLGVLRVNSSR